MAFEKSYKKFLIKATLLDSTNNEDISSYISRISVKKNFVENAFPLFVMEMMVTATIRDILRDTNARISLTVSSFNYSDETSAGVSEITESYSEEELYSTILRVYEKPFTTTFSTKDQDTEEDNNNAPFIPYVVAGVPEKTIDRNKSIINTIYENAKTTNMVVDILTGELVKDDMDLYFEPGDNVTRYKSALIPPLTPVSAIKYIDNTYGLYNDGACALFLDTNKVYMYNVLNNNRDFTKTFTYIQNTEDDTSHAVENMAEYDRDSQTLRYRSKQTPMFIDNNRVVSDAVGSDITYYSYNEAFDIVTRKKSRNADYTKDRYFWNPIGKAINENSFGIINSDARNVGMIFTGVDPEFFSPDTSVIIESEYQNISGNYTIYEMSYSLSSSDRKEYLSEVSLALKKIK